MIKSITIQALLPHFPPYTRWYEGIVTEEMIRQCVKKNDIEEGMYNGEKYRYTDSPIDKWTAQTHARRIAYFVKHGIDEPIDIEITQYEKIIICDGNHRYSAAVFMGIELILCNVFGFIGHFPYIFP